MHKGQALSLARRLSILLVLAVALLTAISPVERKATAVPCEQCEPNYLQCLASCEPCSSAALQFCENRFNRCLANCTR